MLTSIIIDQHRLSESRDSSVGIVTRNGLDDLGIESRWGCEILSTRPDRPWGHLPSYTMGNGSFPGVKRPGRGVDHTPSKAEVKERVELYLYSPSVPSWPDLG